MAKKKTKGKVSRFRSAVSANVKKQKSEGARYGYFNLPADLKVFKEEPGSSITLDIIPYIVTDPKHMDRDDDREVATVGTEWYKKPYLVHRNIGASNDSYVCPTTIGKKCPICMHRAQLLKEGGDWQDDDIRKLRPSKRNMYVVVPLNSKEYDQKPHLWDISQFLFQDKLNEEINEDLDMSVFPDPDEGFSLRIRFSEESFGKNKFASTSRIDFKEREHSYSEKDIKALPDIDSILRILSFKALEAKFFDYEDDDEDDNFTSVRGELEVEEEILELDEDDLEPSDEEEDEEYEDEDDDLEEDEDEDEDEEEIEEEDADEDDEEEDEIDIPEEERCVACSGTGKSSKGTKCKPCDGTGRKKEKPKAKTRAKTRAKKKAEPKTKAKSKSKAKKKDEPECPHGYEFGVDCEKYDECETCDIWDKCVDASGL